MAILVFGFLAVVYIAFIYIAWTDLSPACSIILILIPAFVLFRVYVWDRMEEKASELAKAQKEEKRKKREFIEKLENDAMLESRDRLALIESNYRCAICGGTKNVVAVDIRTFMKSISTAFDRRIALCDNCQIDKISPANFERLVGSGFVKMGYGVQHRGCPSDGGIDLYCTRPGEVVIVQCKHYHGKIGVSAIRDFYGTLIHNHAAVGYFVTTGKYTDSAIEWAKGKPIRLIARSQIADLLLGK